MRIPSGHARELPWRRPRFEWLALLLVALVSLAPAYTASTQDDSRLALTQQLLDHATVRIDPLHDTSDVSFYGGHWYSNKAPGMSIYALPHVAVAQGIDDALGIHHRRVNEGRWHRWLPRLTIDGPLLLAVCFLLGRVAEGLRAGTGAAVAVIAGTGTLLGPLSTIMFAHVGAALLAFGALLLAWRRSFMWAGVAAASAAVWTYEVALAGAVLAVYVASFGLRPLARFAVGAVPPALLLGAYDWVAFGSPLHLSDRYSADYSEAVHSGFFGITIPSLSDLRAVLTGGTGLHLLGGGLVVRSPVTLAAGVGLLLLWRRGLRREAAVCIAISIALVVMDAGDVFPYGGGSPGPRYLSPMLPFLLLGLPEMLGRARWPTLALAALSIALMTQDALTWARDNHAALPDTIWSLLGAPKPVGAAIVAAVALVAALFVCARVLRKPTAVVPRAKEALA